MAARPEATRAGDNCWASWAIEEAFVGTGEDEGLEARVILFVRGLFWVSVWRRLSFRVPSPSAGLELELEKG